MKTLQAPRTERTGLFACSASGIEKRFCGLRLVKFRKVNFVQAERIRSFRFNECELLFAFQFYVPDPHQRPGCQVTAKGRRPVCRAPAEQGSIANHMGGFHKTNCTRFSAAS